MSAQQTPTNSSQEPQSGILRRGRRSNDSLHGGNGNDTLHGGDGYGHDTLSGGEGDDYLDGGKGHESLAGGHGEDSLDGGHGEDTLYGGKGNDTLHGGDGYGHDTLSGGEGDDTLISGEGNDSLIGGGGADIFVIHGDHRGQDTIMDFTLGADSIMLTGGVTAPDLRWHFTLEGISIKIEGYSVDLPGIVGYGVASVPVIVA
ncbi:MAG: hypothetical protein EBE86_001945 [Hormoscilla sp. GUM202]|nr:hypothetical protein [Hormoscilla sp. GUM202]